jgi:type IV pilus assembly protein PilB
MKVDEVIQSLILENASANRIRKEAISRGMKTLRQSGLRKVTEGITSLEEVLQVSL